MSTEETPENAARATPVAWVERTEGGLTRMWSGDLSAWAHRPANPEPLYSAATVTALEAEVERLRGRVAQLSDVIGEKELATEDECQVHRAACFELSEILIRADVLAIVHDGGTDAAWKNIIESVKSITGAGAK